MKENSKAIDLQDCIADYTPNESIWNTEPEHIARLKGIIWHNLEEWERNIILYYAEYHSQRKVAARIGVSVATACLYLRQIRNKIKTLYART